MRARLLSPDVSANRADAAAFPLGPSLRARLAGEFVGVIAEIKRSSPSKGAINPAIDTRVQSLAYEQGGAAAISVLTEPDSFGGADADVTVALRATTLPVLKKDFHVATNQLIQARALGAAAALVIVRALDPSRLADMARTAREIGLELVFEIRDEAELEAALAAGADIIGVNNRDLETLKIDPTTVERIIPLIPRRCVAIAESGYSTRDQVETAARAGADAVLVGSSVSASANAAAAVRNLTGVPVTSRRR